MCAVFRNLVVSSFFAIVIAACFKEPASTSDGACMAGQAGCRCAAERLCDTGFECAEGIDVCIPVGCAPGDAGCTCDGGTCTGTQACTDGVCTTPIASTSGPGSVDGTTTTTAVVDGSSSDAPASSGDSSGHAGSETSTTGPSSPAITCGECLVKSHQNDCATVFLESCAPNSDCVDLASCVGDCLEMGDVACTSACCDLHPNGLFVYADLVACDVGACRACAEIGLGCS